MDANPEKKQTVIITLDGNIIMPENVVLPDEVVNMIAESLIDGKEK